MFGTRTFAVCALALTALVSAAPAEQPDDADAVRAVRKAAETAELHTLWIHAPRLSGFLGEEVKDWPKLAESARSGKGPLADVWRRLPLDGEKLLNNDAVVAQLKNRRIPVETSKLQFHLEGALRRAMKDLDFYDPKAFKDVVLSKETKALVDLGEKRTHIQTLRMNRALLSAALPEAVIEPPQDYHRAHVRVTAGKEVILILSSSSACRWEVEVEKGGKVVGVLLSGHAPQEIGGVGAAPVVYRASHTPDGKGARYGRLLYDHEKGFTAAVTELLGREPATYQDLSSPPKDGFIVPPKAK